MRTRSPRAAARPVRMAAPFPWLLGWRSMRTVESSTAPSTLSVPSVEPSSTTIISRSTGSSTSRIRRRISSTVFRSLYTGTMTVRSLYSPMCASGTLLLEHLREPGDGALQSFPQRNGRLPAEQLLGQGDVGLPLGGVVDRERFVDDLAGRTGELHDDVGQLPDGELVGVADVHGTDVVGVEQPEQAPDLIVDVAEAARLAAVAVHRDRLALQGLDDEVGDDPAVVRAHTGSVRVEDPHDTDVQPVAAVVRHRHRL